MDGISKNLFNFKNKSYRSIQDELLSDLIQPTLTQKPSISLLKNIQTVSSPSIYTLFYHFLCQTPENKYKQQLRATFFIILGFGGEKIGKIEIRNFI
jgi:hypothetical protein